MMNQKYKRRKISSLEESLNETFKKIDETFEKQGAYLQDPLNKRFNKRIGVPKVSSQKNSYSSSISMSSSYGANSESLNTKINKENSKFKTKTPIQHINGFIILNESLFVKKESVDSFQLINSTKGTLISLIINGEKTTERVSVDTFNKFKNIVLKEENF